MRIVFNEIQNSKPSGLKSHQIKVAGIVRKQTIRSSNSPLSDFTEDEIDVLQGRPKI